MQSRSINLILFDFQLNDCSISGQLSRLTEPTELNSTTTSMIGRRLMNVTNVSAVSILSRLHLHTTSVKRTTVSSVHYQHILAIYDRFPLSSITAPGGQQVILSRRAICVHTCRILTRSSSMFMYVILRFHGLNAVL
jgi:hypothetical protein